MTAPLTPEVIAASWPLSSVALGPVLEGFGGGVVQVIETKQGRFVCKRAGHLSERSTLVLDFLAERSFAHAPRVVHTDAGTRTLRNEGATFLVMEHIDGAVPTPTAGKHAKLAAILAHLNSIDDYPVPAPITVDAIRPAFHQISRRLERPADRARFAEVANSLGDIDRLPRSLIHFESSLGNTIERPDGSLVLVDWDEAGTGARVLDAGKPLISAFISEDLRFDVAGARAFYDAYQARLTLSAEERDAMFDASLFHALRSVAWADPEIRWRRIEWAIEHRHEIMSAVRS